MKKLTDLEQKGENEVLNLKKGFKKSSFKKTLRERFGQKDISDIAVRRKFKIFWHDLKGFSIYLWRLSKRFFKKLTKHYDETTFRRSLEGTLPKSFSADKLNLKQQNFLKRHSSISFLLIIFALFLLANLGVLITNSATLKASVMQDISTGYELLRDGYQQVQDHDLRAAGTSFEAAGQQFEQAKKAVVQINRGVNLISISPLSTGSNLLASGENLSKAGQYLSESATILLATQNINQALDKFELAYKSLGKAQSNLAKINPQIIPTTYRTQILEASSLLDLLIDKIDYYAAWIPELKEIFGQSLPKRYLIAFLNSSESRPCGGFLGSFAIADFDNGALKKLEVQDIYNVDWQLWESIPAPLPLQPFMKTLHMRDSTYLPDFTSCAEQINYFYERAYKGSSLDGVIAISENLLEDLFILTGPVELDNLSFNENNFFTLLQVEIESNKEHPETPKQILIDLVPKMQEQVMQVDPGKILPVLQKWIASRDLQVYFFDQKAEKLVENLDLSLELTALPAKTDFLLVTDFNVGGNKSDRYLFDQLIHRSNLNEKGEVYDVLIMKRIQSWDAGDKRQAYLDAPQLYRLSSKMQQDILFVLGQGSNHNVTEIWVPKGSELIEFQGLNKVGTLEQEFYTVFYFDWEIPASSSKEIILKYKLPFQFAEDDIYTLQVEKQAAKAPFDFSKELDLGRTYYFEDGSTWYKENFSPESSFKFAKRFARN
ncbi:MAG: DUF4012 domain-containing protein [Candidatus Gracilibacteria bacterium]|nr:DUF4012 domain-containing protein [Candidatus Gracilibacteria bacterium]